MKTSRILTDSCSVIIASRNINLSKEITINWRKSYNVRQLKNKNSLMVKMNFKDKLSWCFVFLTTLVLQLSLTPPPKKTLTSVTDDLRRRTVYTRKIQIHTIRCYHSWFWQGVTCLVIEKASESAHCEVFGRLFPHEERDCYLLEIATEFFGWGGRGVLP